MSEAFDKRLRELLDDNIRGSRAIAVDVAAMFDELLDDPTYSEAELLAVIRDASARLQEAHPSLVAVWKLCDAMESALAEEAGNVRERLAAVLAQWRGDRFDSITAAMAGHLLPSLNSGCRILCHSHSSTVLGVLKHARRELESIRVVQTVSYPMKEGIRMAEELANAGIDVRLIADAGTAAEVGECDLVLLGADSIHKSGVVNKLGSFGIALAAKHFGVPVYAVADLTKLVKGDDCPEFEQHDPAELTELQHPRIEVDNVYFEVVPFELFAKIVTEEGMFIAESILARLQ